MIKVNAEERLVGHYTVLNDLKSDFRNYNLFTLVASLVKGSSVVDIGCGTGSLLKMLKKRGKKVLGLEPASGMRELAAKINPEITVIGGMADEADSLIREKVDTVTMIDVLEHLEKDAEQVKKVFSVLNADGEFIVVVPAHPFLYGARDKQMGHYRRYSKKMLTKILSQGGFRIESIRHWNALGFLPYLLSEKILHKPLESKLRQESKPGTVNALFQKALNLWFRYVENNFDFGFGLSIMVVAKKAL